ncbi:MAG: hypothetical protein O7E52_00425, partial [Candidatus Poribacteria bacterium]|nr:hypothetical protein [Candidatus Poribacteria bacterium]
MAGQNRWKVRRVSFAFHILLLCGLWLSRAEAVEFAPGVEAHLNAPEAKNTFVVYVPTDYTLERPWPVIFCYHGYRGQATTWPFRQTTRGVGFIVVGMNSATKAYNKGAYQRTGPEKAFFDEALAIVSTHLNVHPKMVFMGGYSQGGYSTTVLGEQMLDKLAGLIILGAGRGYANGARPPAEQIGGKPIFFGVGELDEPHNPRAKNAAQHYSDWGAEVTFEEWPGETHRIRSDVFQTTKLRDWLIVHGPLKQVEAQLVAAKTAQESG